MQEFFTIHEACSALGTNKYAIAYHLKQGNIKKASKIPILLDKNNVRLLAMMMKKHVSESFSEPQAEVFGDEL